MARHKISNLASSALKLFQKILTVSEHKINCHYNSVEDAYWTYNTINAFGDGDIRKSLEYYLKHSADQYPKFILNFSLKHILNKEPIKDYYVLSRNDLEVKLQEIYFNKLKFYKEATRDNSSLNKKKIKNYPLAMGFHIGIPYLYPLIDMYEIIDEITEIQYEEIEKLRVSLFDDFDLNQKAKVSQFNILYSNFLNSSEGLLPYLKFLLEDSWYSFEFERDVNLEFNKETETLIVDYLLPSKQEVPNEGVTKKYEWGLFPESKFKKIYEEIIYSIVIRTLAEIFHYDSNKQVSSICFNGKSRERNLATGNFETKYILSIIVNRESIENLDLEYINPKDCFKFLKGVSASKLYDTTEIQPIITPEFADKRIIESRKIEIEQTSNIAEMDWEDFEHLVRQIFEWEFADKGGEVNVTQSSRDGGVDAIVFDPDPIRGGKIIIQAKRYTNTVPVSAVRDLYGTIINEGANKGILITTSDYGPDSYKFAQGKPITLLNGGHLLYLLKKHGRHARIDLKEAKEKAKSNL